MLYFYAKLNLSKLPRFLYMNQQLSCNKLRKMDKKSNEFFDSSTTQEAPWEPCTSPKDGVLDGGGGGGGGPS